MRWFGMSLWFMFCGAQAAVADDSTDCGPGIPPECTCFNQELKCTGSSLLTFPNVSLLHQDTLKIVLYNTEVSDLPTQDLMSLQHLEELDVTNSRIRKVDKLNNTKLETILLEGNEIEEIADGAFDELPNLVELMLNDNKLEKLPTFSSTSKITKLSLRGNPVKSLPASAFLHLPDLFELDLSYTHIETLPGFVFNNTPDLYKLDFSHSKLSNINENGFVGGKGIRKLNLDDTKISSLPTKGLSSIEILSLKEVKNLWQIPKGLDSLQNVTVSKSNSFLCCAFYLGEYLPNHGRFDPNQGMGNTCPPTPTAVTTVATTTETVTETSTTESPWGGFGRRRRDVPDESYQPHRKLLEFEPGPITDIPSVHPCVDYNPSAGQATAPPKRTIHCTPGPDAFSPCENIMGADWLTALSFLIGWFAIIGNLIVLVVILTGPRRMTVAKFLMCNLAFADFCLGLYIFILVCMSISTSGVYYNHVKSWQFGYGCQITGFLAVFSSMLSLYTLAIITAERFITIVYAMDLNFRLRMRKTIYLMTGGWIFSLLMAFLPLFYVSSYSRVAICLPFQVDSIDDVIYLTAILVLTAIVFIAVMICYIRMYLVVSSPNTAAPHRSDAIVAKRMAVLVFTDFACWCPIAFFGLMTTFGYNLIDVTHSKYLLVFFFPLNSCCNPFFYAIMTKAFRRQFFGIMSRLGFCHKHAIKHNKSTGASTLTTRLRLSSSKDLTLQSSYKVKPKAAVVATNYKKYKTHTDSTSSETPIVRDRVRWSEEIPLGPVQEEGHTAFSNSGYQPLLSVNSIPGCETPGSLTPDTPRKDEEPVWDDEVIARTESAITEGQNPGYMNGDLKNSEGTGKLPSEVQAQVHRQP